MMTDEAREARNEYMRNWRKKNREKVNERNRKYREKNKEKVKEYNERYWAKVAAKKRGEAHGQDQTVI